MRGTEEGMDEVTKEAIEAASEQAAQDAVEAIKPYFDAKVEEAADKAAEKVRHHFDVSTEQIVSEIKAIGEGDKGNAERLDTHERRIERLERAPIGHGVGFHRSAHLISLMARSIWARRWWMNLSVLRRSCP